MNARYVIAEVVKNQSEGDANHRLRLAIRDEWARSKPGQFLMMSLGTLHATCFNDPLLPRPMAIYKTLKESLGDTHIEIMFKVVGRGTALLAKTSPGDRIGLLGPLGRGFPIPSEDGRAVLVGGGTGIASLFDLATRSSQVSDVSVLLGAKTASEVMGLKDFEALPVALKVITEDGSAGSEGLVTEALEEALRDDPSITVYACGPTPMMRRAAELASSSGATCYVSLENRMACGYGVCLGCAVPNPQGGFSLVCSEGPVMPSTGVVWKDLL